MNGLLAAGTVCLGISSSMNAIENVSFIENFCNIFNIFQAPYWSTAEAPNGPKVNIQCKCPGGCNSCHWEVITDPEHDEYIGPNILGVPDVLPKVSHLNGYLIDYNFVPGIKVKL